MKSNRSASGDLSELRRLIATGADISRSDYDGRTALHLAACEGQVEAARLLIGAGCDLEPRDRWGNTPLDDAKREKRYDIVALLRSEALDKRNAAPKKRVASAA